MLELTYSSLRFRLTTYNFKKLLICFFVFLVVSCLLLVVSSFAAAKEYDGLWFLGFNLKRTVPAKIEIRQAVSYCLSIDYIAGKIISDEVIPGSIVPPGMDGYDKNLIPPKKKLPLARQLVKKSNLKTKNLRDLILLHTDGIKTVQIAEKIRADLLEIGIQVKLKKMDYADQENWEKELKAGKFDFYLMGYKADNPKNTMDILKNLFYSKGEANFSSYKNGRVDQLIDQTSGIKDSSLAAGKFKEINQIVSRDLPIIGLFYITRL